MKNFLRKIILSLVLFLLFISFPKNVLASEKSENYLKAKVTNIVSEGEVINNDHKNLYQDIKVRVDNGKIISVHVGDPQTLTQDQKLKVGDSVILFERTEINGKKIFQIYDKYRFNNVLLIMGLFAILVIIVAGIKGLGSLIGLSTSLATILIFIIPQILAGHDPLIISIIGSIFILLVSTYIAHGISKQTSVALISTFIALFITAAIAIFFTSLSKLSGIGDEDIASLQIGTTSIINLKGLFLAGVIIGTLGALNDVTITQAATVFEFAKSEPSIKLNHLVKKGFNVGREHILSLVNTLVLAYAGSSLFIFIFLVLNPVKVPYWVILNTETISGEIVSTIAGSTGLILAVPIATFIASWVALKYKYKNNSIPTK